jgi:hypothetical protein
VKHEGFDKQEASPYLEIHPASDEPESLESADEEVFRLRKVGVSEWQFCDMAGMGEKTMKNEFLNLWTDMLAKAMDSFMKEIGMSWKQFPRLPREKQEQINSEWMKWSRERRIQ